MTLPDFYDCFLSYERKKSYDAMFGLIFFPFLWCFFFCKFMEFYLLAKQFAPFTFFISRCQVSGAKKFFSLYFLLVFCCPKNFIIVCKLHKIAIQKIKPTKRWGITKFSFFSGNCREGMEGSIKGGV